MVGPGFKTPHDAIKGPREKLIYIPCIQPDSSKPDYLATVDVDPESPTYSQVIHRLYMTHTGDELHHSGWNACSSHHGCKTASRDKLILPGIASDRIYIVDMSEDPKAPKMHKVLEPEVMHKFNLTAPHTSHCLPNGDIAICTLGNNDQTGKGQIFILDGTTFEPKGTWSKDSTAFGYDFWYQPHHNVLISTQWGAPKNFKPGFTPSDVGKPGAYGKSIDFFDWKEKKLVQTIEFGDDGWMPFETRFLHNPKSNQGYVGNVFSTTVFRFHKPEGSDKWHAHKVIDVPAKKVEGWALPEMPGLLTDFLFSMDDKWMYMSNWMHGDIRQYDVTDPAHPVLKAQCFIGGLIPKGGKVKVTEDKELKEQPAARYVQGKHITGGPQMLQLSLDGKRLYVSNSLFSPWDRQFYPDQEKEGSALLQLDVDHVNGGLKINEKFLVDFGKEPHGPVLAHEIRYPGGDCTSDIFSVHD